MASFLSIADRHAARRAFLARSGLALSGAAVALLAGRDALAARSGAGRADDVRILNTALGAEHEAVAAYQLGAESGLLQKPVLDVAVRFQNDHKEHADTLAGAIRKMGGKPVQPKALGEYAKSLKADTLKSQNDVLDLAARLELDLVEQLLRGRAGAAVGLHSGAVAAPDDQVPGARADHHLAHGAAGLDPAASIRAELARVGERARGAQGTDQGGDENG